MSAKWIIGAWFFSMAVAKGQMAPIEFLRIPLSVQSGELVNSTSTQAIVHTDSVLVPGCSSFRLEFRGTTLGDPADRVLIADPIRNVTQALTTADLERSNYRSGWFNGDQVLVSLELAPGSSGFLLVPGAIGIAGIAQPEDICGSDNRVLSNDNRSFRLIVESGTGSGICTGWLISDRSTFLTAGHCFGASTNPIFSATAEFNVPPSASNGAILHPALSDQFDVDLSTLLWNEGSIGSDWAVARAFPNQTGLLPSTLHGFFNLATAVPSPVPARMTGFGGDLAPDPTRNFVQQTSTDSLNFPLVVGLPTLQPTGAISHDIDSQPGNSGGPLIWETTGLAVGIHTHGGCANFLSSNRGTSIFFPPLVGAIATVNGCASVFLPESSGTTITCTPTIYTCAPTVNRWNIVGVSSTSNWNISREFIGSTFTGDLCDFMLADGSSLAIPGISGRLFRASGSDNAVAQHAAAVPMTLGQTLTTTWNSQRILRAFQFVVTQTGSPLQVQVTGQPGLKWHVYRPDSSLGSEWRSRTTGLLGAGTVGAGITNTLNVPVAGTYCLVVYRDGGAIGAPPDIATVGVTVCQSSSAPLALTANTPVSVSPSCQRFSVDPAATPADGWRAVAVSSSGNYSLSIGNATSTLAAGRAEFAVVQSRPGSGFPLTLTDGFLTSSTGGPSGVLEYTTSDLGGAPGLVNGSLSAGQVVKLIPFTLTSITGLSVLATGDPSLRWYLLVGDPFPPKWRGPSESILNGIMGGVGGSVTLAAGQHVVVIVRDGGATSTPANFTLRVGSFLSNVTLTGPGSTSGSINPGNVQWTCTPSAGRWNAVGTWGFGFLSSSTIYAGEISSVLGGTGASYVLANGRAGTITPASGIFSLSGSLASSLTQSTIGTFGVDAPANIFWANGQLFHLMEFQVTTTANYSIQVTGVTGIAWQLFRPTSGAEWRPRSDFAGLGGTGSPAQVFSLSPGWHVLVLSRGGGITPPSSGTITCSVVTSPNPVPTIAAANPASLIAGEYLGMPLVTLQGTGFVPNATARWDGIDPLFVDSVTGTTMGMRIPVAFLTAPGNHTITVTNPAPGGGTSNALLFPLEGPIITSVTPDAIDPLLPLGTPIPITVAGTGFSPLSVASASGTLIPTTVVSANQITTFVTTTVAEALQVGGIAITVRNGAMAQSNSVAIRVGPPANNRGTLVRVPLEPNPGQSYSAILEAGTIGQAFTWFADLAPAAPIPAWPNPTDNFVLGVNPALPTTLPLLDGLGVFGPPQTSVQFSAGLNATPPGGVFLAPGFVWPVTPLGLRLNLQHIYLDPGSAIGYRLSWPFIEDL